MDTAAPPPPDRLLTCQEVADQLRISTRTLFNLAVRGELKPVHIGRAVRYRARDIGYYLDELSFMEMGSND